MIPIRDALNSKTPIEDYSAEKLQKVFDRVEKLLDESSGTYYEIANHACANLNLYLLEQIKQGQIDEALLK